MWRCLWPQCAHEKTLYIAWRALSSKWKNKGIFWFHSFYVWETAKINGDSRYRCDALNNWAMKSLTLGAGHLWVLMSSWRMDVKWYMKCLLERRTGIARSRVQNPLKSWLFQASIHNCLNCVHNCDDHSLLYFEIFTTHSPQNPKCWRTKRKRLRSSFSFFRRHVLFHVCRIFASFVQILS